MRELRSRSAGRSEDGSSSFGQGVLTATPTTTSPRAVHVKLCRARPCPQILPVGKVRTGEPRFLLPRQCVRARDGTGRRDGPRVTLRSPERGQTRGQGLPPSCPLPKCLARRTRGVSGADSEFPKTRGRSAPASFDSGGHELRALTGRRCPLSCSERTASSRGKTAGLPPA